MSQATPRIRYFATRLIAHEASAAALARTENQTAVTVVHKLRPKLEEFMGDTGFGAVVSRAVTLAKDEAPWLGEARSNAEGKLEGLEEAMARVDPEQHSTGGAVVIAWLLALLASFIGEILTMQLVIEVWPKLSFNGYFTQGEDDGETR